MGLSSTKTKSTNQETATTTPNLGAAAPLVNNYFSTIGNLSGNDLKMFPSELQQGLFDTAMGMVGTSGAETLSPAINGLGAAMGAVGGAQGAGLTTAQAPAAWAPVAATAATAELPGGYTAGQAAMMAYPSLAYAEAPDTPELSKVDTAGILSGMNAQGFGGARALSFMNDYQNPFQQQVIDATVADARAENARNLAAYERMGAKNRAFGGSDFAIGEATFRDAQGRAIAKLIADLRSQGWDKALAAGQADAGFANAAGIASMQSANQMASDKAGLAMSAAKQDAQSANDLKKTVYEGGIDLSKTNANFLNDALSSIFNAGVDLSKFNTGEANDALKTIFNTQANLNQSNANNVNAVNIANANNANDALSTMFTTAADLNKFNANATNDNAQFNSNFGLDQAKTYGSLATSLGNVLTDAGNLDISKLGAIGNVADSQAKIDNFNSPVGQAELLASLINGDGLAGLQTGQTVTSNGTSTSKQSGGLGAALIGALGALGSAAIKK